MKFFILLEKSFKNGFYIDYFFKNLIFYFYKSILGNNFFYFFDKYITEKAFFFMKNFFTIVQHQLIHLKNLSFFQILQLFFFLLLQIILIIML